MSDKVYYEQYPAWMVAIAIAHTLLICFTGAALMLQAGPIWAALYLLFCAWCEYRVLSGSCVNCCYYGKTCAFGRGKVSAWFFRPGDPAKFNARPMTWASLIPDMLVSLLPLAAGVIALIRSWSWLTLGLMVLLLALAFPVTGAIRGQLACSHCRQRQCGCPAERLFGKTAGAE